MSKAKDLFSSPTKTVQNLLIIDMSNILHAAYHSSNVRFDPNLTEGLQKFAMWRFLILSSILKAKNKFKPDEIVLALDHKSWRKKEFKYYKANRDVAREKDTDFNYEEFISVSNEFIKEIEETFPFKTIKLKGAEADDIIAVLVSTLKSNITIVSRDKDFKQLLKFGNIKIYDPISDEFLKTTCPYSYLTEHILKGDSSDGIPNMLSVDNIFLLENQRQKSITKKIKEEVNDIGLEEYAIRNNLIKNYERNKKLIELTEETIPSEIWEDTIYQYNNQNPKGNYIKIMTFFKKRNIKGLINKIDQFMF